MKVILKSFTLTILFNIFSIFTINVISVETSLANNTDCQNTIQKAKTRIESKKTSVIAIHNYKHRYEDNPKNRPLGYVFFISGTGVDNILNSRLFLTDITTSIIANCNSVSLVTFGVARTDAGETYGLMKNGKVEPFKCIAPNSDQQFQPNWGEQICL
ncbi:MAG TPA: hypothetical protein V6D19_16205 [Stenomitos sp.]